VRKLCPTVRPGAGSAGAARGLRRARRARPARSGRRRDHGPWTACDACGRRRSGCRPGSVWWLGLVLTWLDIAGIRTAGGNPWPGHGGRGGGPPRCARAATEYFTW